MTTIAANLEMMVADSKVSVEAGVSYPTTKIIRVKSMILGAAGHSGDCSRFLEWGRGEFKGPTPKFEAKEGNEDSIHALVLKKDGLYFFGVSYPEPEKVELEFFAIGSGGKAARVAMKLGYDPIKAVELACEVDDYTGPPIVVLKLKE